VQTAPARHYSEGRTIPESERCATRRRVRNGRRALALCVMVLAGVAACGDSRDPVSPIVPAQLVALTSTDIVAVAGSVVTPAPMARVLDSRGVPVGNVSVTFELAGGAGSVLGQAVTSDVDGVVRAGTWTLGTSVGISILRARLSATPSIAVDFMATTHAGSPASIVRLGGDAQRGPVGEPLAQPLLVQVVDRFGNAVSGAAVTFTVMAGGGTIAAGATTNGAGIASSGLWTLGPAVTEQRLVASLVSDVAIAGVEFHAIAYEPCAALCTVVFMRAGDIHVSDADGTGVRKLTSDGRNDYPAWSPDGKRIAFSKRTHPIPGNGVSDIYIMNADGSNVIRRTTGANLSWATWSPDGRTLAVSDENWYEAEIHLLSVENDGLPPKLFAIGGRSPQWSPDGQRIVFVTTSGDDGYHQVFVGNADGSGRRALTPHDGGTIHAASWSPSGDRIAYSKCLDSCELYIMNADGSATHQVTRGGTHVNHAAWSPDGLWIAFTVPDVYVISPGGDGKRLVVADAWRAAWRP
jgi:hypothetical protein